MRDSYGFLNEMLDDLRKELSDVNALIQCNLLYIKEAEVSIKALEESESDEFKMFSPRSMSDRNKEEIARTRSDKARYEEKNRELYESKEAIENKIECLEKILKQENNNFAVFQMRENDRQRIAAELHDTSLQNLAYLIHKIELCNLYIDEDPAKAKLELSVIGQKMREVIEEIRNVIFDLRPMNFDDLGLKSAIERFIESINEDKKFELVLDIDDVSCENKFVILNIYRIVQESLVNVVKHADADKIIFRCKMSDDNVCVMDIVDNGKGFYAEEDLKGDKHFGISLMKERVEMLNGRFEISSAREKGTEIHIEIPIGGVK